MDTPLEARCPFHSDRVNALAMKSISRHAQRTLRDLPSPKGIPFLGNLLQLDVKKFHSILESWAEQFGTLYRFQLGSKTVVVASDVDMVQDISKRRPGAFQRLEPLRQLLNEIGVNGVFSAEGEQWVRQRKFTSQALNTSHLQNFFPTLLTMTERLKARWDRAASAGHTVEVRRDLMRYTIDVTTNLAFGYDVNSLEDKGDKTQRQVEQVLPMISHRMNAPFPYWHFIKLPADRALDRALHALRETVGQFIANCRRHLAKNPDLAAHPTNFLEALLAAQEGTDGGFTDDEIFGNIMTMLVAGEDTTAYTLAWMIHFMAEHPDVQERMQREVDEVLDAQPMLQNFRDHGKFPYLEAVAYETLRLKSVVPVLLLETNHEVELDDVKIPAHTPLFLLLRKPGLEEQAFVAARQFQPERWLAEDQAAQPGHNTKAFMPFGVGPRFCPGRNLALLEIKAVMSMLCRNFTITRCPQAPAVEEQFAVVMMPSDLHVELTHRQNRFTSEDMGHRYTLTECPYAGAIQ